MNLPEVVKIGAITYAVCFVDDLHDGGQELLGWYRHDLSEIQIKTGMSDDLTTTVFWHELTHAILEHAGHEQSEPICNALSYGLVAMFESNDWSISYDQSIH